MGEDLVVQGDRRDQTPHATELPRRIVEGLSVITEETVSVQTPRSKITMEAFADLPAEYPAMPLIGLGPGQFSSRAALIGTREGDRFSGHWGSGSAFVAAALSTLARMRTNP